MLQLRTMLKRKIPLALCGLVVCLWDGCSSKSSSSSSPATTPNPPLHVSFLPVENPVNVMCTDDTLTRTEWFNVPVVRFSGSTIKIFGRTVTTQELQDWATKYYYNKAERGLWVQIAPGSLGSAEDRLLPLVRMFPDLHVFHVEFEFSCPKIRSRIGVRPPRSIYANPRPPRD